LYCLSLGAVNLLTNIFKKE